MVNKSELMRPCYVAALASIGWYLMAPPIDKQQMPISTPMSGWIIFSSHDTATDCERVKDNLESAAFADAKRGKGLSWLDSEALHSMCIATDDPRLKGD